MQTLIRCNGKVYFLFGIMAELVDANVGEIPALLTYRDIK